MRGRSMLVAAFMVALWPARAGGAFDFFSRFRGGGGSEKQLYEAAEAGDVQAAQTLLEQDTDPDKVYGCCPRPPRHRVLSCHAIDSEPSPHPPAQARTARLRCCSRQKTGAPTSSTCCSTAAQRST